MAKVIEDKMIDFTFERRVSRGEIFASKDIRYCFSYIADCDEMNIDDILFVDNTGRFKLFRYGCETFACIKIVDRFTDTWNSETWILYFLKVFCQYLENDFDCLTGDIDIDGYVVILDKRNLDSSSTHKFF